MASQTSGSPDSQIKWTVHGLFNEISTHLSRGQTHFTAGEHDEAVAKVAEASKTLKQLMLTLSNPHEPKE
jgi:hypothetical protein